MCKGFRKGKEFKVAFRSVSGLLLRVPCPGQIVCHLLAHEWNAVQDLEEK